MAVLYLIIVLVTPDASDNAKAVGLAVGTIAGVIVYWLYNGLSESGYRQATPGKKALAIRVVTQNGDPLSFDKSTTRIFCKFVSALTLGVGFLMCLFTKEKQCLHDMISGCQVVDDDR